MEFEDFCDGFLVYNSHNPMTPLAKSRISFSRAIDGVSVYRYLSKTISHNTKSTFTGFMVHPGFSGSINFHGGFFDQNLSQDPGVSDVLSSGYIGHNYYVKPGLLCYPEVSDQGVVRETLVEKVPPYENLKTSPYCKRI